MSTEKKLWKLWLHGKASEAMAAHEVWDMLTARSITEDTLVERDGDSRGWTALSSYKEDLRWAADERPAIVRRMPPAQEHVTAPEHQEKTMKPPYLAILVAAILVAGVMPIAWGEYKASVEEGKREDARLGSYLNQLYDATYIASERAGDADEWRGIARRLSPHLRAFGQRHSAEFLGIQVGKLASLTEEVMVTPGKESLRQLLSDTEGVRVVIKYDIGFKDAQ